MATSNFGFTLLQGSDKAGYNSINSLVTSIDNAVYAKVAIPGMIMMWNPSGGGSLSGSGWTDVTTTLVSAGFPALPGSYKYIQKAQT
jgi:hypothetical protein